MEDCVHADQDEIFHKVSATLVEALNVDEDEIKPTSTLQGDLGAESIDFLDIVFRLEREFGIKIPRGELFPESIFQGDPEFVQNGKVTDKGLDELRTQDAVRRPEPSSRRTRKSSNLSDLFTVEMITRYIQGKLAANASESDCPLEPCAAGRATPASRMSGRWPRRRLRCAGSGSTAFWNSSAASRPGRSRT